MKHYALEFSKNGSKGKKIIKAKNLSLAQDKALKQGFKILSLQEIQAKNSVFYKLKIQEMILFFKELSLLCEVGLSLSVALKELENSINHKALKKALQGLSLNLNQGQNLAKAFENSSFVLNSSELALLKMAENTGKLAQVFHQISELKERIYRNQKRIQKALSYPLLVFLSLCFAFIFLMLFVVPNFKDLFENMGVNLPLITRFMLGVYEFLDAFLLPLALVLFCAVFLGIFAYKNFYTFALFCDRLILKLPLFSSLIKYHQNYYFFVIFSLLLKSAVPINKAFELASLSVKNKALALKFQSIYTLLLQGMQLDLAFRKIGGFDTLTLSMLSIAMKSAKLDSLSEEIAKFYAEKQEEIMQKILSLLEPLMTLCVAILVLFLALGIFLPMWELNAQNHF